MIVGWLTLFSIFHEYVRFSFGCAVNVTCNANAEDAVSSTVATARTA